MAPVKPRIKTTGKHPIIWFEGAIETTPLPNPGKAFTFEVHFFPGHPRLLALGDKKPPLHFHPYQVEYFKVIKGRMTVEMEGYIRLQGKQELVILINCNDTGRGYQLDQAFFENWYSYQDQIVSGQEKLDIIQMLAMFDAGDSYLSLPWYIPCGKLISQAIGIAVGRWVGGLLGYQPFYREWTSDWNTACKKMQQSVFQRKFAKP